MTPGTPERVIAIDGPSAAGKSTVARRLADRLGRLYVDSGSLYRAVTRCALEEGVAAGNAAGLLRLVGELEVAFFRAGGAVRFRIRGAEPGGELRDEAVNRCVSEVSAVPGVRRRVVAWLRETIRFGDLVMEGRDIGTAVFPETRFKFFLDASPEERARRRHREYAGTGPAAAAVATSLRRRDAIDAGRATDPLRAARDAVVVDSTDLTVEQVVERIASRIRAAQ